jgi:hypothetical protein
VILTPSEPTPESWAMIELLAIPSWKSTPATLSDWQQALAALGFEPVVARDADETWIEVAPLRLRGYVELAGPHVEAINFELHDTDTVPASRAVVVAARNLGWEVHPDDPEEDDVDED